MKNSKNILIGLIFVVSITMLIWGINILQGSNVFKPEQSFVAMYSQVNGLVETNPVLINGVKVGQVEEISINENSQRSISVVFTIDNNIKIPKNTIARIYSADLMGSKSIALIIGDALDYASTGDTLTSEIQATLQEEVNKQVAPLKKKTEDLISSIDTLITAIRSVLNEKTRENLQGSFDRIGLIIKNIEHTSFSVDTLVQTEQNKLKRIVSNLESITFNVRNSNEQISNIIKNFSSISDSLAKVNIARTISNTDKALYDASQILEKINKGEGTIGQLVNNESLYNKLDSTAKDLDALLIDLKANPKRYVHLSLFGKNPDKK